MTPPAVTPAVDQATDFADRCRPLAATVRSRLVECVHHGTAVALDASRDDARLAVLGDPTAVVLPRSALKLLHAVAFLENGLDVDGDLLAVTCASHSGEPEHLATVRRLLDRFGLSEAQLQNTPDVPLDPEAAFDRRRAGHGPSPIAQNCSGNHTGMLATCVASGWDVDGYLDAGHPVQRAIARTIERLAGSLDDRVPVDGCGAPAFAVPLLGLARAFGRLTAAADGSPEARVAAAVRGYPWVVGGTGRLNTALMQAVPGLVAKDGADGIMALAMPGGLAVAIKVLDGADRPRAAASAEGLRLLGVDVPTSAVRTPVLGGGREVGEVVALPWEVAGR